MDIHFTLENQPVVLQQTFIHIVAGFARPGNDAKTSSPGINSADTAPLSALSAYEQYG
jgi:hypothetical protein